MFKKSLLLTLLLALLVPWAANAQQTVTIGEGTVTCNTNPIGTYYNYSIAEQLYTAQEIGMAGTISSVSFYYMGNAAKDLPITMYMKHVDEANLSSAGISLADATEVFNGTLSVTTTAGWVTINLDTPFDYDGTSNLLIGFIKDYLYYFSGQTWQGTATTATMARYTQSDSAGPYTTGTVPGTAQANRPNIQMVITPSGGSYCARPTNLTFSNVEARTATLDWSDSNDNPDGWWIKYRVEGASEWIPFTVTTQAKPFTFTGLTPETTYEVKMSTICSEGNESIETNVVTFTTIPSCYAPTNLTITDLQARTATLDWSDSNDNPDGWWIYYRPAERVSAWTSFTVTSSAKPFTFTGLTPETTYEVKMSTICGDNDESSYTDILSFSTDVACPAPTVAVGGITAYTAEVSCTNTDAEYFNVKLGDDVVGENVTMPYTLTNLDPETNYTVKVQAICGGIDGESQWTSGTSFTTAEVCPDGMVCIGQGTATSGYVPANNFYKYSLTEQIYTAAEIGEAGAIYSIDFYKASTAAMTRTLNIYMVSTTKDEFTSNTDWITVTANDLVYSGSVTFTNNDWTTIELDNPFIYDGTNNVCLVVDDNTGSYNTSTNFRVFTAEKIQTIYQQNDNTNLDPTAASVGSASGRQSTKNRIRLNIGEPPACPKPTGLIVSNIAAHEADLTWTENGEATSWIVEFDTDPEFTSVLVENVDDEPSLHFQGLTPETTYYVRVKAQCAPGNESDYSSTSFTTTIACPVPTVAVGSITAFTAEVSCTNTAAEYFNVMLGEEVVAENVAMPYTLTELTDNTSYTVKVQAICGGEDGESAWSDGTTFMTAEICPEGMVCIGTGIATNQYLPTYTYYNYSLTQQIYTAAELGAAGAIMSVDFFKAGSNGGSRNLDIYLVSTEKETFTGNTDWIAVTESNLVYSGEVTFADDDWTTIEFDVPFTYNGTSNVALIVDDNTGTWVSAPNFYAFDALTQAIRVYSDSDNYDPTNPGSYSGAVLNQKNRVRFAIGEPPACAKPTGLTVHYIGGITAEVAWEGEAETYNIDVNGTVTEGVTSPYTLEDLELGTTYAVKVQADCGSNGTSDWTNPVSFTTDLCLAEDMCELTFVLTDSYGDGWNGAYIDVVDVATGESLAHMSNQNVAKGDPETETYTLAVCDGRELQFVWHSGSYDSECSYVVSGINGEIFSGSGTMSEPVNHTVSCSLDPCAVPGSLAASEVSAFGANLSWTGNNDDYNLQYRHSVSADTTATTATIILTVGDIWGDGSGYQMLLDADATAYGTIIPEIGSYGYISADGTIGGSTGDVASSVYNEFEYKIPVNADGALTTENIVINNSISIEILAGTYDWCITNPTSGNNGRMWIASNNGNVGGRYDDFVFEAGLTYEFTISNYGSNDGVDVTITPMSDWTLVEDITSPYNFTGLTPHTLYEWQVQGISSECEGGVTEWSNTSSFITQGSYYWFDPETWQNDLVPADYTDVTIPAGITVIVCDTCTAYANEISFGVGGSIYIEDGGQLYHSNEIPVTLQLNYEPAPEPNSAKDGEPEYGEYRMIASPVNPNVTVSSTGLVPASTDPNYNYVDLYYFDESSDSLVWINYKDAANNFTTLDITKGYLYSNRENVMGLFAGNTLSTNDDVTVNLDYTNDSRWSGWNLVGNPFTCMAYIDRPYFKINATGDAIADAEGNSLEVFEGVFVKADSLEINPTLTFTTTQPQPRANLALNLSNGSNLIDRAIVRFDEGRQLPKFQLKANSTKVYIPQNGVDYAVVNATEMGEMPVSFKAESNGTYTMNFTAEEVSFNYLHLIDNMTGADVDLLATPTYTFNAKTTDYASRFKLVFATGNNSNDDNFAFFSNGSFVINNEGKATLQVIDVTGRIVKSESINGCANINVNAAPGVYMLRLVNGDNVMVQKVVVR